jgi:hypothetical protein
MMENRYNEHVRINRDDVVRQGRQTDPRFIELYRRMQAALSDREYGYRVCLHEAAHAVLMEQDGIKNVQFSGPEITYDPSNDDFSGAYGRAEGDPESFQVTEALMFRKCLHSAAGGVALRKFAAVQKKDAGDGDDYAQCWMRYEALRLQSGRETLEETPKEFWKRAQEAASTRLDDPDTKTNVLAKAQEYLLKLYPSSDRR